MVPSCEPASSDTGSNPNRYRYPHPYRFTPVIPRGFGQLYNLRVQPIGLGAVPSRSKPLGLTVKTEGCLTYKVTVPDRHQGVE